jgi:hypothetical protein
VRATSPSRRVARRNDVCGLAPRRQRGRPRAVARAVRRRRTDTACAHAACRRWHRAAAWHAVATLSPCLMPHCAALDWEHWSGTFTSDARSLAPYQGTPEAVASAMLSLAALAPGETFVDLGAGDARVMLHAVQHFHAGVALGWELDPAVHALGLAHVAARLSDAPHLAARVTLHCGDAREAALAGAHVIALYLLPEGHAVLAPLLEAQLPPGCGVRVVAHGWPLPGWTPTREVATSMGTRLYLYVR